MAKTPEKSYIIHLQLTCLRSPQQSADTTEVEFGLQDRQQMLAPGQLQPDGSLLFETDVTATYQGETQEARLRGPHVHGTTTAPFLYLSLRRISSTPGDWISRMKVPLPRLAWEQIEAAQTIPRFTASVAGDRSGTVSLLGDGWVRNDHSTS